MWDHAVDPFQAEFDARRELSDDEEDVLLAVVRELEAGSSDAEVGSRIATVVKSNPDLIHVLLQSCGLTRNKILTDLKASSKARDLGVPSRPALLPSRKVWKIAGPYLAKRLRVVLGDLVGLEFKDLAKALEALNQATWPGWIRQERAKRQGHEAEHRIATLLFDLELDFEPREKVDNPLCRDADVAGESFDIVAPTASDPGLCVKSTVQTANIGQFGESKGHLEVAEAVRQLEDAYGNEHRPILLAMVDGVGFLTNRDGLEGILSKADEFCQFKTLWKAGVLAGATSGIQMQVVMEEPEIEAHAAFFDRYKGLVETSTDMKMAAMDPENFAEAGEGYVAILR